MMPNSSPTVVFCPSDFNISHGCFVLDDGSMAHVLILVEDPVGKHLSLPAHLQAPIRETPAGRCCQLLCRRHRTVSRRCRLSGLSARTENFSLKRSRNSEGEDVPTQAERSAIE